MQQSVKLMTLKKGGKVQDKAEEILKANGQWDKYTKKALLGDRNVFKRFKKFLNRLQKVMVELPLIIRVDLTKLNIKRLKLQKK